MDNLVKILKSSPNIIGIKQSFEDEGALPADVLVAKQLAIISNKIINLKIGGCEALTDMMFADSNNIDGVVAPMIESKFALKKYINASKQFNFKKYFNVETIECVNNLDDILSSDNASLLDGLIIGRSDLCGSMGLDKSKVDSLEVCNLVYKTAQIANSYGISVMLGGSLTNNSIPFIKNLIDDSLLSKIETRNIIISVNKNSNIESDIKLALEWELQWMKYKSKKYKNLSNIYLDRYNTIKSRFL